MHLKSTFSKEWGPFRAKSIKDEAQRPFRYEDLAWEHYDETLSDLVKKKMQHLNFIILKALPFQAPFLSEDTPFSFFESSDKHVFAKPNPVAIKELQGIRVAEKKARTSSKSKAVANSVVVTATSALASLKKGVITKPKGTNKSRRDAKKVINIFD